MSKQLALFAVPLFTGFLYLARLTRMYSMLPQRIATHYDIHGIPNGWMSRSFFASFSSLFLFCFIIGGAFLIRFAFTERQGPLSATIYGVVVGLLMGAFWSILSSATKDRFQLGEFLVFPFLLAACMFIISSQL